VAPGWGPDAVFYHVYPLGLCGAPATNDGTGPAVPRLARLHDWIDHWCTLGVNALYLGPLFESSTHGYDTTDYFHVDRRLGDDETLASLVAACHRRGIRVILDGVFHHVGRGFWGFRELRTGGMASPHRDWFAGVDFSRPSPLGDAFSYDTWRGHHELVKLALDHRPVRDHLLDAVRHWFARYDIDGLRLDVAESIKPDFLRELAGVCRGLRPDCWLLGEMIHGDYSRLANPEMLDSATNYEAYKGLWSSHEDRNYFEIAHTLERQFGPDGRYRGLPLYAFADNHDVTRVASRLSDPGHLYPLHVLLFTMPGVPSIYYGSEWGLSGVKRGPDDAPLRPAIDRPTPPADAQHPELAAAITRLAHLRRDSTALRRGDYRTLHIASEQLAFARTSGDETMIVTVNASHARAAIPLSAGTWSGRRFVDRLDPSEPLVITNDHILLNVPPCWGRVVAVE
jgi:cyclomaltodextrinase / maltogenic alpha-amylase / neopullulanase